mgnify:CR=1 FL=1
MEQAGWKLNEYECFEAPAVTVLFYHNHYEEGKQGGVEIIQRSQRIAGNGNLRLGAAPGQWGVLPHMGSRQVSPDQQVLSISGEYREQGLHYTVRLRPEGKALRLTVIPENFQAEYTKPYSFNLELIPSMYMGQAFILDEQAGIFPRQFDSPMRYGPAGHLEPVPLAEGRKFIAAPDEAAARLEIEALSGELNLLDGRAEAQNGWFVVRGLGDRSNGVIEWRITPAISPGWIRPAVIGFSQVGYHPLQKKVAVIELDAQTIRPSKARLVRLHQDGTTETVKTADLPLWGEYLCYHYAQFDFSEIRQPGLYRLEYEDQATPPFPIQRTVFQQGVWQPTLETFFPVQMCHMEVRDIYRVWHGACHLDDALQAPLNHQHFDGYHQGAQTETPYAPLQHIPYLDAGGWHDAGDYDLAAGSQASTTFVLALAYETFGIDSDQTTVDPQNRKVILHVPDGIPDIVQQIMHGVENLLSGYRAAGHSFVGIIENKLQQYVHLGDPATMTDNLISEGESDDRWAFTNRDTALEFQVCAALAAASRALRGWNEKLATECLETARKIWSMESSQPPQEAPNAYTPRRPELQQALAAVELLLTTGEAQFRLFLLSKPDLICTNIAAVGGAVARVLQQIGEAGFEGKFQAAASNYAAKLIADANQNPFGLPYTAESWRAQAPVWGIAWTFLGRAVGWYFLRRAYPNLFPQELLSNTLTYVLGCHPVSNASLVSGVGAKSLTMAYGINRADWTYIPGGVVSGPALLKPNYPELHDPFPFLWQQKEYVMGGAATYLFLALAVNAELEGE